MGLFSLPSPSSVFSNPEPQPDPASGVKLSHVRPPGTPIHRQAEGRPLRERPGPSPIAYVYRGAQRRHATCSYMSPVPRDPPFQACTVGGFSYMQMAAAWETGIHTERIAIPALTALSRKAHNFCRNLPTSRAPPNTARQDPDRKDPRPSAPGSHQDWPGQASPPA